MNENWDGAKWYLCGTTNCPALGTLTLLSCVVRGLCGLEVHSSHILQWILTARNSTCLYKWKNEDFLLNLMHPSDPQAFFSLAADTQN